MCSTMVNSFCMNAEFRCRLLDREHIAQLLLGVSAAYFVLYVARTKGTLKKGE